MDLDVSRSDRVPKRALARAGADPSRSETKRNEQGVLIDSLLAQQTYNAIKQLENGLECVDYGLRVPALANFTTSSMRIGNVRNSARKRWTSKELSPESNHAQT